MLEREEYIEQEFFFRTFLERLEDGTATQEILHAIRAEVLTTTRLPMAIDFLLTDMKLTGGLAAAMAKISHYFTAFQSFVISETERESGRFDVRVALAILEKEAKYRSENPPVEGLFFYQFETLCRNRLGYDKGLEAIATDRAYDAAWKSWLATVRKQIGLVDFADMIFVRSACYKKKPHEKDVPVLFGEREGRIAHAARRRDPTYFFAALSRHLGYPSVPRRKKGPEEENLVPTLLRRIEILENRISLIEEERRGGIDIERFYT